MKQLDWAAMFEDMQEVLSEQEVSRRTGVHQRTIKRLMKENFNTESWDVAIKILDTYLKIIGVTPPKIGGYNVYIKEDEVA